MENKELNNIDDDRTAIKMDADARKFLMLYKDPATRPSLLARLQELGLLSEFLEAEN